MLKIKRNNFEKFLLSYNVDKLYTLEKTNLALKRINIIKKSKIKYLYFHAIAMEDWLWNNLYWSSFVSQELFRPQVLRRIERTAKYKNGVKSFMKLFDVKEECMIKMLDLSVFVETKINKLDTWNKQFKWLVLFTNEMLDNKDFFQLVHGKRKSWNSTYNSYQDSYGGFINVNF